MSDNNHAALRRRLEFIGLDDQALSELGAVRDLVDKHLPVALKQFYARVAAAPEVSRFFDSQAQMQRAEDSQLGHWKNIAAGRFDETYVAASTRIGLRHAQIGLEPRWYIGGYGLILETLIKGVLEDFLSDKVMPRKQGLGGNRKQEAERIQQEVRRAASLVAILCKAVIVDIDMAVSVYFDKITSDARERQERDIARVSRAVAVTGAVLKKLAQGDLTSRVTEEFDAELQPIKHDTNGVADQLTSILTQLRETSRSLRFATSEIMSGANDLAERTTRQAANIQQTSAAMAQLAGTVVSNAEKAENASGKVRAVSALAEEGGEVMQRATGAMERINTSSDKIANIVGLIDDIAFQTNLLALNASVEAARAGEAGKGFSVVAVEVRRLAQSAAEASREIKELIEQSGAEVRAGSDLVADAAAKLRTILEGVRENRELVDGIAEVSRDQALSIEEVGSAIRQLDEMTQHNAALVEEINAAIEQTEGQAGEIDRIVDVFVLSDEKSASAAGRQRKRA